MKSPPKAPQTPRTMPETMLISPACGSDIKKAADRMSLANLARTPIVDLGSDVKVALLYPAKPIPHRPAYIGDKVYVMGGEANLIESWLHKKFVEFRVRGEWFHKEALPLIEVGRS